MEDISYNINSGRNVQNWSDCSWAYKGITIKKSTNNTWIMLQYVKQCIKQEVPEHYAHTKQTGSAVHQPTGDI